MEDMYRNLEPIEQIICKGIFTSKSLIGFCLEILSSTEKYHF